jgi:hypothetical protein
MRLGTALAQRGAARPSIEARFWDTEVQNIAMRSVLDFFIGLALL